MPETVTRLKPGERTVIDGEEGQVSVYRWPATYYKSGDLYRIRIIENNNRGISFLADKEESIKFAGALTAGEIGKKTRLELSGVLAEITTVAEGWRISAYFCEFPEVRRQAVINEQQANMVKARLGIVL